MTYQPIEDYGIIGDLHTVALVGKNGSIDWLCFPHFDSPSIFAAILDDAKGGRFQIAPTCDVTTHKQLYWFDTNVLITRFLSPEGVGEIVDYMPVRADGADGKDGYHQLIRHVKCTSGAMPFLLECAPRFDYARDEHTIELTKDGATFRASNITVGLAADTELQEREGGVCATFTLNEGDEKVFVLRHVDRDAGCGTPPKEDEAAALFKDTVDYWRKWIARCTYRGRWREMVHRSALVLKLLTYQPTGAIIAAPTCSLPESIGGGRNFDYRYTWFRDAAFTVYALLRIGFTEEAAAFIKWVEARCHEPNADGSLQIVYGVEGEHDLTERELAHLSGYKDSVPVRIGNGAYNQLQLDIYGELMDAVYLYNKHGAAISYDLWTHLRRLANWVCDNWRRKDEGIWEVRGAVQHFVFSKVMCWVALDRALRLADKRSFPADRERWLKVRDEIYEEVMRRGWSEEKQAFVQAYDSDALDASCLIMPLVFFLSPNDPRMLQTIDAINRSRADGGLATHGLLYRYNGEEVDDGFTSREGTFNLCTFWLVEALTRAGRIDPARLEEAQMLFEQMLGYANHLGLYSEQIGANGQALGNFPQALTHLSLISAAFNLDRELERKGSA